MWIVLTGAPGSGKSTICDLLARDGSWIVLPEAYRWGAYIVGARDKHSALLSGIDLVSIQRFFEDTESAADKNVCADRSMVDLVAYQEFYGGQEPPPLVLRLARDATCYFRRAFYSPIDPERYANDAHRTESLQAAMSLERCILTTYERFGLHPTPLPGYTAEDRAAYVKEFVSQECAGV